MNKPKDETLFLFLLGAIVVLMVSNIGFIFTYEPIATGNSQFADAISTSAWKY